VLGLGNVFFDDAGIFDIDFKLARLAAGDETVGSPLFHAFGRSDIGRR